MLTEAPHISVEEISAALGRLKPGKVMPSNSAPAALWKRFGTAVCGVPPPWSPCYPRGMVNL